MGIVGISFFLDLFILLFSVILLFLSGFFIFVYFIIYETKNTKLKHIGDVVDPITRKPYSRDPRRVGKAAVEYLRSTGIAHDVFVGPEQV
jgi:hypothetical protein